MFLLSLQQTNKAKSLLNAMADGAEDAEPTRYAKQLLDAKPKTL